MIFMQLLCYEMVLSPSQFLQRQIWLTDEAHEKVWHLGLRGDLENVSYDMLIGTGPTH